MLNRYKHSLALKRCLWHKCEAQWTYRELQDNNKSVKNLINSDFKYSVAILFVLSRTTHTVLVHFI